MLGHSQPGLQSAFDAVDLIKAMASGNPSDVVPPESDDESSSVAYHGLSISSPAQYQTPLTNRSSIATHGHDSSSPIYRFSDNKAHRSNNIISHGSSIAPHTFPGSSSQRDGPGNGDNAELATRTWSPKKRFVILNVNNERVDADLKPVVGEEKNNPFKETNQQ